MVIYADILFLVNLYIDFFLIACVKKFLRLHVSGFRLFLGALAGAFSSLCALLPVLDGALSVFVGIASAFLITAAAFAPIRLFAYLKAAAAYWLFSFLFAGFFLLLSNFFPLPNLTVRNGTVYFGISPLMLFIFTLLAYAVISVAKRFMGPAEPDARYVKLTVENLGQTCTLYAKSDTGNALKEPFSGLPVIVAEANAVKNVLPPGFNDFSEEQTGTAGLRLIPYQSISGEGILPAFKPQKVFLAGKDDSKDSLPCYIAVSSRKLSSGSFCAVFNPDLLSKMSSGEHAHRKPGMKKRSEILSKNHNHERELL